SHPHFRDLIVKPISKFIVQPVIDFYDEEFRKEIKDIKNGINDIIESIKNLKTDDPS
ncbi:6905_t:CDS:2, partial [Gigaspora margarita]